ncbi:uncharacterized protein B0I36DRAFT_310395 [Microdochium trichocladiopsis]|uniref:Uncharacterized protein n=1 Tax=Microdochium trichocladiopsis TaxID=1682393 RepID=A0A9P9BZN1_9PEZI|nr:uncharacterized protein B0I36DRAFT_310395 [Microdochium trichocladiopsis]KAH7040289.1 hypothetical protein B0I36DRAFT_310395 [Microdochium trichocladiopsis]
MPHWSLRPDWTLYLTFVPHVSLFAEGGSWLDRLLFLRPPYIASTNGQPRTSRLDERGMVRSSALVARKP